MYKTLIALLLAVTLVACSHHPISNVNYAKYNAHTTSRSISSTFTDIGRISTDNSDFIFKSCEKIAEDTLAELINKARAMGGNAVTNLEWTTHHDLKTLTPTCEIGWGWFAIYVVGGLGPWVKSVEVSATVVNIPEGRKLEPINVFMFNRENSDAEIAKLILAQIR